MPDAPPPPHDAAGQLFPAKPQEVAEALAYALRYDERGRPRPQGGEMMAKLAAEHLTQHLERCGFVVMRQPAEHPHRAG